jgi:hypothetical protein
MANKGMVMQGIVERLWMNIIKKFTFSGSDSRLRVEAVFPSAQTVNFSGTPAVLTNYNGLGAGSGIITTNEIGLRSQLNTAYQQSFRKNLLQA